MTTVISMKQAPKNWRSDPQYVYIGRPSIFGNPFKMFAVCDLCGERHMTGGDTLDCFEDYFQGKLVSDRIFEEAVRGLYGKTLVCFCKPAPCHGDIIARYANTCAQEDVTLGDTDFLCPACACYCTAGTTKCPSCDLIIL